MPSSSPPTCVPTMNNLLPEWYLQLPLSETRNRAKPSMGQKQSENEMGRMGPTMSDPGLMLELAALPFEAWIT